jgi:hypothetical protein
MQEQHYKEISSEIRKIKYKLAVHLFWGIVAIIVAVLFVWRMAGNPYYEYLLVTKGVTTKGEITDVSVDVQENDAGGNTYFYDYTYKFTLPSGETIQSKADFSSGSPRSINDSTYPFPTDIVYLESKPSINKIKNALSKNIGEILWRKVGLGSLLLVLFGSIGFVFIRNAIKDYVQNRKKIFPDDK